MAKFIRSLALVWIVFQSAFTWAFDSLYPKTTFQSTFTQREECLAFASTALAYRDAALQARYQKIDPVDGTIKHNNYSRIYLGQHNTAVLLLHGFSASPFEVEEVAKYLHQHNQYTVIIPLIEGFGATAHIANQHTLKDWQRGVREDIALLSLCYDKVILGGFSLGAALLTDYLFTMAQPNPKMVGFFSLSPFLDTNSMFLDFLQNVMGTFQDSYSYQFMYDMSENQDIKVILQYPEYYLTEFPMKASKQVIHLGELLNKKAARAKLNLPYFLSYTDSDTVISQKVAAAIYRNNFGDQKEQLIYSKELKIPHQITRPEVNPLIEDLLFRISAFTNQIAPELQYDAK